MEKNNTKELKELLEKNNEDYSFDGLWVLMILALLFSNDAKQEASIVNIYVGDDKNVQ